VTRVTVINKYQKVLYIIYTLDIYQQCKNWSQIGTAHKIAEHKFYIPEIRDVLYV